MQTYRDNNENAKRYTVLRYILIFTATVIVMGLLTLVCAAMIAYTGIPESAEGLMSIMITALVTVGMAAVLTATNKTKPIISALIYFIYMISLKTILTCVWTGKLAFGKQGIIGIVFTAVFSLLGALIGTNFKK